jgi:hypothetical protein
MASAVAITIVVIFMISVSLFMSEDKVCRRPSFQIGSINLSLAATHGQCDANALLLASSKCSRSALTHPNPVSGPRSGYRDRSSRLPGLKACADRERIDSSGYRGVV